MGKMNEKIHSNGNGGCLVPIEARKFRITISLIIKELPLSKKINANILIRFFKKNDLLEIQISVNYFTNNNLKKQGIKLKKR